MRKLYYEAPEAEVIQLSPGNAILNASDQNGEDIGIVDIVDDDFWGNLL